MHTVTAGAVESPQFLSADVTGVGEDEDDWIVTVEWSEPVICCAGSVSQYVLTVTPPTPDCGSEDCVFMTEETQNSLTLTVDQTYSLTVRADTCRNTQRGDDSDPLLLRVYGELFTIELKCLNSILLLQSLSVLHSICHMFTAGALESPQFLSADVTGVGEDEDDWIVTVEWSEPVIRCAGSVSQYVLTVTPPTPDCGSEDCVFMTEKTQYNLTLTVDQTYNLTVRADTCRNTQTGDDNDPISLTIYGEMYVHSRVYD